METLGLKLIVTPLLICAASLAGRRWGPSVSGWLVGLPLTSGPVVFFVTLSQGSDFGAATALGILAGTASQAAFGLAYGWTALRSPWPLCLAAASVAFAACTVVLRGLPLPGWGMLLLSVATLLVVFRLLPGRSRGRRLAGTAPPSWDLPARMAVATAFVLALTTIAPILGPRLTGLLSPFPIYATVLSVFAQRQHGSPAAIEVLRGLQLGLFGFAAFFFVLASLLEPLGLIVAFAIAIAVGMAIQGGSLAVLRRLRRGAGAGAAQPSKNTSAP